MNRERNLDTLNPESYKSEEIFFIFEYINCRGSDLGKYYGKQLEKYMVAEIWQPKSWR